MFISEPLHVDLIMLGSFVVTTIVFIFLNRPRKLITDSVQRALSVILFYVVLCGALGIVSNLLLPVQSSLPVSESVATNPGLLIEHLREVQHAQLITTRILRFCFFIIVFACLGVYVEVSKLLKARETPAEN